MTPRMAGLQHIDLSQLGVFLNETRRVVNLKENRGLIRTQTYSFFSFLFKDNPDYNEVKEFPQAKTILYNLKINYNPKLRLSRIMSYICSW